MTDLLTVILAIAICTVVSIVWYYMSAMIANGFSSREDMTIPIFITGMIAFALVSLIAAIIMIWLWY
jgi:hypothetical protein